MCADYRGLNKLTIKNRYSLPLISNLSEQLQKAKVYTKIDLCGVYNLVCIKEGDDVKIAFQTRYSHFEYNVMPFWLTNVLTIFQHMMNDIFWEFLDDCFVIFIDEIFIYSENKYHHKKHNFIVLSKLQDIGLYAKLEKCEFHQLQVEFLGYIISNNGVSMDLKKVQTIVNP